MPAPKQRACSVPLHNRFCILSEEPAPAWSRGHMQHRQSEVPTVMTTATGSRGYVQHKRALVADNSAPLRSTEHGQKKSSAICQGINSFFRPAKYIHNIRKIGFEPVQITVNVNSKPVQLEIDIGSFLTTINEEKLKKMCNIQINPTTKRAIDYSNSPIEFKGETNLNVECNNMNVSHTFLIVDSNSVSLLGRDLCSKLNVEIILSSDKHFTHAVN